MKKTVRLTEGQLREAIENVVNENEVEYPHPSSYNRKDMIDWLLEDIIMGLIDDMDDVEKFIEKILLNGYNKKGYKYYSDDELRREIIKRIGPE